MNNSDDSVNDAPIKQQNQDEKPMPTSPNDETNNDLPPQRNELNTANDDSDDSNISHISARPRKKLRGLSNDRTRLGDEDSEGQENGGGEENDHEEEPEGENGEESKDEDADEGGDHAMTANDSNPEPPRTAAAQPSTPKRPKPSTIQPSLTKHALPNEMSKFICETMHNQPTLSRKGLADKVNEQYPNANKNKGTSIESANERWQRNRVKHALEKKRAVPSAWLKAWVPQDSALPDQNDGAHAHASAVMGCLRDGSDIPVDDVLGCREWLQGVLDGVNEEKKRLNREAKKGKSGEKQGGDEGTIGGQGEDGSGVEETAGASHETLEGTHRDGELDKILEDAERLASASGGLEAGVAQTRGDGVQRVRDLAEEIRKKALELSDQVKALKKSE